MAENRRVLDDEHTLMLNVSDSLYVTLYKPLEAGLQRYDWYAADENEGRYRTATRFEPDGKPAPPAIPLDVASALNVVFAWMQMRESGDPGGD